MKKTYSTIMGFLIWGGFLLIIPGGPITAQKIRINQEAGIPVVYNPKNPDPLPGVPTHLTLVEELVLGGENAGQEYPFSLVSYLVVDDDQNMIVLDNKETRIKIFDRNGKLVREFGRKGEGAGELQFPTTIMMIGGNEKIGVIDPPNHRYSCFSMRGDCLKEVNLDKYWRIRRIKSDREGNIYANFSTVKEDDKDLIFNVDLIKLSPDFNFVRTFAGFEEEIKRNHVNMIGKRFGYDLRNDNSLVWAVNSEYVLYYINQDGAVIRKIIKDCQPQKITRQEREALKESRFGDREIPANITLDYPKHYPFFFGLILDEKDRIYVRTYRRGPHGGLVHDVFDPLGRYITEFEIPEQDIIFALKHGKAYIVNREGIPSVTRYAMIWDIP